MLMTRLPAIVLAFPLLCHAFPPSSEVPATPLEAPHLDGLQETRESPPPPRDRSDFARGADIGWLSEMEASGKVFHDRTGAQRDLLSILRNLGVNAIRLRVWVNPTDGWCGREDVLRQATRAQRMGFRTMIDFHYSDSWADPGKQAKPSAWAGHDLEQLKTDVHDHTASLLRALKDSGVSPEWVQVGNETNNGMLWEEGKASVNMAGYAALVSAGSKAVREILPQAKIVVHVSNSHDNGLFRWNFDGLKAHQVDWDVIGMSLYPEPGDWREKEAQTIENMKDMISRYGKSVMISEIGMDWNYADTTKALLDLLRHDLQQLPGDRGLGVFYWEPGSYYGWKGYFKGAFDDAGRPTVALTAFQQTPVAIPPESALPAPAALTSRDAAGRRSLVPLLLQPSYP